MPHRRLLSIIECAMLSVALLAGPPSVIAHGEKGHIEGSSGGAASNSLSFPTSRMEVLAHLSLADIGGDGNGVRGNDTWGWTDPETGKEYALMGRSDGVAFIDVSDPRSPVYLGILPKTAGSSSSIWRDMKVYQNKAYIVADNSDNGLQIFDLTQLRDRAAIPRIFSETARYDGFGDAHNIAINEATGFGYAVGAFRSNGQRFWNGGLVFLDLNKDPSAPGFAAGGYSTDGYTHDTQVVTYAGPDSRYFGREVAFSSNEDTLTIVDVDDKRSPALLSRTSYSNAAYIHQGWLTEDHRYFISNDELDERDNSSISSTRTHIWDVSDLHAPVYRGFHDHGTYAIDHNLYVRDGLVFAANYTTGLRVLCLENLTEGKLQEVAWVDTHPSKDGLQFQGAWSVYPFFESGTILVSDINEGLVIVRLRLLTFEGERAKWRGLEFSQAQLSDNSLSETVWGDHADPDGDGISNFFEFAYDTDPLDGDPQQQPSIAIKLLSDPNSDTQERPFATYTFQRRKNAHYLDYRLQGADRADATDWHSDFELVSTEPGSTEASERVTYRSLWPIEPEIFSSLFVRLSIETVGDH